MSDYPISVRALYDSVQIPTLKSPYDTITLKLYYPADYKNTDAERNTGVVALKPNPSPYPVVIFSPGVNVSHEAYSWLGHHLAEAGYIVVTYSLIGEEMPGFISLTPGVDIDALRVNIAQTKPNCIAYQPIIEKLRELSKTGLLANGMDLTKIVFGGHSAGGSMALLNANPEWFDGVSAAFSYGAHTGTSTILGHAAGTLLDISPEVPVLIMGGTRDGCIAQSSGRYGEETGDATERVTSTFDQSISRNNDDCAIALLGGANHFTFCDPVDTATGRGYIDFEAECDETEARQFMAELTIAFLDRVLLGKTLINESFGKILNSPKLSSTHIK